MSRLADAAVVTSLLAWAASVACSHAATAQPEPAYARAESVPADISARPHVVYQGRLAYFVNDRWYVRQGPHWVYYLDPPPELVRREPPPVQAAQAEPSEAPSERPPSEHAGVRAPEFGTPAERAVPSVLETP